MTYQEVLKYLFHNPGYTVIITTFWGILLIFYNIKKRYKYAHTRIVNQKLQPKMPVDAIITFKRTYNLQRRQPRLHLSHTLGNTEDKSEKHEETTWIMIIEESLLMALFFTQKPQI